MLIEEVTVNLFVAKAVLHISSFCFCFMLILVFLRGECIPRIRFCCSFALIHRKSAAIGGLYPAFQLCLA